MATKLGESGKDLIYFIIMGENLKTELLYTGEI